MHEIWDADTAFLPCGADIEKRTKQRTVTPNDDVCRIYKENRCVENLHYQWNCHILYWLHVPSHTISKSLSAQSEQVQDDCTMLSIEEVFTPLDMLESRTNTFYRYSCYRLTVIFERKVFSTFLWTWWMGMYRTCLLSF